MIHEKFLIKVIDYMKVCLPRPVLKDNILDRDRAESLSELNVIMEGYPVC